MNSNIGEFLTKINPFAISEEKKKYSPKSMPGITGKTQRVTFIENEFNEALDFTSGYRDRLNENIKLYSGLDNGQWDSSIVSEMENEGRNPFQGNFIRSKVDGLAGSIVKNWFDISFEPVEGHYSDLCKILKDIMLSDKELLDWNNSYMQLVIDGLICSGLEEMFISDRYSPLGNIGFRRLMPGHYIIDPNWLSNDGWDMRRLWKTAYLNAEEIKNIYNHKSEEIDAYVEILRREGSEFNNGDTDEGIPRFELDNKYGEKFRVIEYHHMEKEKGKIEVVVSDGSIVPEGTDEEKREWALSNNIDMSYGIVERDVDLNIYYVTSICPDLSNNLLLEDRKGEIQIGRLPFFHWSAARINGKDSGIPDLLKSLQQTYNKRESMLDHMISSNANGASIVDPDLFDNDESSVRNLIDNWTNSRYLGVSTPGALSSGRNFFQVIPKAQMDYGIVNEINRMLDMSDRISKHPAASDARSEGSEESGILFARKQLQAEITQTTLIKSLEHYWNEKGEAYFLMAKRLYSDVYRRFYLPSKEKSVEINKPIITHNGEIVLNDISELPRSKVIISQSPEGVTMRAIERTINTELLRVIGPENPVSRAQAVKNVMKTLDGSSSERAKMEYASEIERTLAEERAKTEIMQLKLNQTMMNQQLQQLGQPQLPGMQNVPQGQQPGGGQQQAPNPPGNPMATIEGSNKALAQS